MVFNDTTNEDGLCQEIDTICKTTTTSYPLAQKARRLNNALDGYFQKAMAWCGNWSIGDTNNTSDLANASTDLINGQQDYGIDQTMLVIESVWVKDSTGTAKKLEASGDNFETTDTGVPTKYTKTEQSIIFDVIPNYSYTDGIIVYFRRTLPHFSASDTTETAGIPTVHEPYLCRMASLPYLIENGKSSKNDVAAQIVIDERDIQNFYAFRGRDERPKTFVPFAEDNR